MIRAGKHAASRIERLVKEADLAVIRLPSILGLLAVKYAETNNKPYLIEMVGCPWDTYWNYSLKGKLIAPFMYFANRRAVKNAPFVLYVSSRFLQTRYPNNHHNISCSDVVLPPPDREALNRRLDKIRSLPECGGLTLGTIAGNINVQYKRQDLVIKAIALLNRKGGNYTYRLVGDGDKTPLRSLAQKYGIAEQVIFEGPMKHERIFDFLDDIDLYIQPSAAESHGRVILEAMSRGCPCIGSSTGGIPELIDNKFIFNRNHVKGIVQIMEGLNRETLLAQAARNFKFAGGFAKDTTDNNRKKFFLDVKNSVGEGKTDGSTC